MMKRAVNLPVLLVLFCFASLAQVTLTIPKIGINDSFGSSPQAITFEIKNLAARSSVYAIEIQTRWQFEDQDRLIGRYKSSIELAASESRRVEFPISFPRYGANFVRVLAFDRSGRQVARRDEKATATSNAEAIAAICNERMPHCSDVWTSILANSNDEQTERKQKKLNLIALRNPGAHYWSYAPARYLILARPAESLTVEARNGIEEHVRMGGVLIWAAREVGKTDWLSVYRDNKPESTRAMGRGAVYVIPSVDSPLLSKLFNEQTRPETSFIRFTPDFGNIDLGIARGFEERSSTHFNFPSLRWLLLWLFMYLVVLGFVNFAVLRRLGRLELGWITVPAIAVMFAVAVFLVSSARRPKNVILDQVVRYQLDPLSPVAAATYFVRVSSPWSTNLTLQTPPEAVWDVSSGSNYSTVESIARDVFNRRADDSAYELRFGERTEYPMSLLRWSYEDIQLRGLRRFAGSVVRVSPTRLRNETGVEFRSAMFVDGGSKLVYMLDRVRAGEEIDVSKLHGEDLEMLAKDLREKGEGSADEPYRLAMLLKYGEHGTAFYALADGPSLGATLKDFNPEQRNTALFIVGMQ